MRSLSILRLVLLSLAVSPLALATHVAAANAQSLTEEAPYPPVRADKIRELAERAVKEVVRLDVLLAHSGSELSPQRRYDGAGIHVGKGRILTSAFLVNEAEKIIARFPDGRSFSATKSKLVMEQGLALIECKEARSLPAPELAPATRPLIGHTVYLVANPGSEHPPAIGIGYWIEPPGAGYYGRASLPARNGHPLYDIWGRVVGLAILPAKAGLGSLVVPSWAIRKFLDLPDGLPKSDDEPAK